MRGGETLRPIRPANVIDGRLRGELLAWLAMILLAYQAFPFGLAYNALSWGERAAILLPEVVTALVLALVVWDAFQRRVRWYLVVWLIIAISAFGRWPPWTQTWNGWANPFRCGGQMTVASWSAAVAFPPREIGLVLMVDLMECQMSAQCMYVITHVTLPIE